MVASTQTQSTRAHGHDGTLGPVWSVDRGDGPIVAAAVHQGHELRPEVEDLLVLDDDTRLREEDPLTGFWTQVAGTKIRVLRSRFETDLNRPRDQCVPLRPEDAWGLKIWKTDPPAELIERSRRQHDAFYRSMKALVDELVASYDRIVVFDLHSYNHRRRGADAPPADPARNPEVNVGTGTMRRDHWTPVVETFVSALREFTFEGRHLDVRENVKFHGGYFPQWLHAHYPNTVCTLSLEFKKFFMDEWTATADIRDLEEIRVALQSTVDDVMRVLSEL